MSGEQPDPSGESWGAQKALQVLVLAFLFPAAIAVGYLGGHWLGARIGWPIAGSVVGVGLGAVAGFWQLYVFLRRPLGR
ncbi:MAG TPA: AtpZ/AtpI family protein [Thermoanaerobaculia bacterium]|nr:AtpZ/AtpI family protein [Thermoanaerobaculia bacterium]